MDATRTFLTSLQLPSGEPGELPTSSRRFDDGAQYRVEIPSVEGPDAFEAVLAAAADHGVRIHRISQGSGIMLQTDAEIERMVALGQEHDIEVCLFHGPRGSWDVGAQSRASAGATIGGSLRGPEQLVYAVEDVRHGCELGLRSVLVADLGLLWVLGRMKEAGELPADLVLKVSVSLAIANPATAKVVTDLGATTINLPVDLSLSAISAIRQSTEAAIDFYVEAPDDFGGTVRHYELPELVRIAAPIHLKFGVRNGPGLYPAGHQNMPTVVAMARERVRRAAIGLSMLQRYYPEAVGS